MESQIERPLGRTAWVVGLAVLVALVAAVSAFAAGGSETTAAAPAASEWSAQPVQEAQATPAPEGDERRGGPDGRGDCPEKGGAGTGGGQSEDQSAAPEASPTAPTPEL